MRSQCKQLRAAVRGFSLVELAVVMAIVAFLLGSLMYTLSAQVEQRNFEDTRRRLEQARELLLSFALGWWACTRCAQALRQSDPGAIVWDEILAFWLVLFTPDADAQMTRSSGTLVNDHAAAASPDTCCFVKRAADPVPQALDDTT